MQNIGIYALEFRGLFYIGLSSNLSRRYRDHLSNLAKGISNYKMLRAYKNSGTPIMHIIEYCSIEQLPLLEESWIKEFNSIEDGLNITSGGDGGGKGVLHNRAIHSKATIEKVFELLVSCKVYSYSEISSLTKVSVSTITNIVDSGAHIWLQELFPDRYEIMLNTGLKEARGIVANKEVSRKISGVRNGEFRYPDLVSPSGDIHTNITNTKKFAEKHGLSTEGICRLCSGKIKSHRKWKLA